MVVTQKRGARRTRFGMRGGAGRAWPVSVILLCMLPGILHYLVFRIVPSLATFIVSFTDISGLEGMKGNFIGLANYREFFFLQNARDLQNSIGRTIIYSLSVTLLQNGIALFVAIIINNKFIKGRSIFRAVYFMPVILGVTIVTTVWKLILSTDGPVYSLMQRFMDNPQPVLANYTLAFPMVIGIQVWMYMGYSMMLFIAGMQNIPGDVYEASFIDGCNEWKTFRYITVPLLWPTITVNLLLSLIGSLQSFEIIYTTTSGQFNTATMGMRVFASAFGGKGATASGASTTLRQGYAASMSIVLFIGVLIVTIISQYTMNKFEGDMV